MVVKPSQQNLIRRQSQEVVYRLALFTKTIQLGMQLDVDLTEQAFANDLPNQTENQVLRTLRDICGPDVDDGTADGLGRRNDDIVVFCDLEGV